MKEMVKRIPKVTRTMELRISAQIGFSLTFNINTYCHEIDIFPPHNTNTTCELLSKYFQRISLILDMISIAIEAKNCE
jgi:hypothetical protein